MDLIVYRKQYPISGEITISGSKNSALAIIPCALLTKKQVIIKNVPCIEDIKVMKEIISDLGHEITFLDNTMVIKRNNAAKWQFNNNVRKLRGSYYFIAVYLVYYGKIAFKSSGGCDLGTRPINYHTSGFRALGVNILETDEYTIYSHNGLKGTKINLPKPSVGATINIMILSLKATGKTEIINAAKEPEVVDVGSFLISMGAKISGLGTSIITIIGTKDDNYLQTTYSIIPDRIEAGTYLSLGCICPGSKITVKNVNPNHLDSYLNILTKIGHHITIDDNSITLECGNKLTSVNVLTSPYPGIPTDLGPILCIILNNIKGVSIFEEGIFTNRYSHIKELIKMGADIEQVKDKLIIRGGNKLKSATVKAWDLRCAAALLVAAIYNTEQILITNIDYLFRGYEDPIKKLQNLNVFCSLYT